MENFTEDFRRKISLAVYMMKELNNHRYLIVRKKLGLKNPEMNQYQARLACAVAKEGNSLKKHTFYSNHC